MLWIKGCSRCRGDLFEGNDEFGPYVKCAQCGRHPTTNQESETTAATGSAVS